MNDIDLAADETTASLDADAREALTAAGVSAADITADLRTLLRHAATAPDHAVSAAFGDGAWAQYVAALVSTAARLR